MTGAAGSAMECLKCHTPLPDGSKFCYACGADVTGGGTMGATSGNGSSKASTGSSAWSAKAAWAQCSSPTT